MKPKLVHKEAMDFSYKAREAFESGDYSNSFDLYSKAAELESQVADFYFDKPELEPTRSVIVRSAAFLNLKAGLVQNAKKYILFGLINTKDPLIIEQLNHALDIAVSLHGVSSETASTEYSYLNSLRQRSIHYVIEPAHSIFGHSVSLKMINEFTDNYLKSLKAYAVSKFKRIQDAGVELEAQLIKEIEKVINPLVTSTSYSSFKFSLANDYLTRPGESKSIVDLKTKVIINYHNEIFINPLTESNIEELKEIYNEEEVNEIFRPLSKIKSNSSSYRVGYYDSETFTKNYLEKIVNKQRKQLLSVKQINQEDIGELENSIIHRRSSQDGKILKKTIFKEQFKSYEIDIKTRQIEPKEKSPIILNEEILLSMIFNSNKGFTILFEDFNVEFTDIEYQKALDGFYDVFYNKLINLAANRQRNVEEENDWLNVCKLIGNVEALTSH